MSELNRARLKQISNHRVKPHSPFGKWLAQFFLARDPLFPVADGRPLYKYELTDQEYKNLCTLFGSVEKNTSNESWAACYCLAVSEIYRREYHGNWGWEFFDERLKLNFRQPIQRYDVVKTGLKYWKRDLKKQSNDNVQYLGTLCAEGGLPLSLLSSTDSQFGQVIKYGLQQYYKCQSTGVSLEECIKRQQKYLGAAFQNDAVTQLFTDTVRILMDFVLQFDLKNCSDPVQYLDNHVDLWRKRFPFALPEHHADDLINQWLSSASEEQKKTFSCLHYADVDGLKIYVHLQLPSEFSIYLNNYAGKTLLNWQLFEGETPFPSKNSQNFVFATVDKTDNKLICKLQNTEIEFARQHLNQRLSVRFFVEGCLLHTEWLPESSFDEDTPLLFTQRSHGRWELFSTADYIRVNVPYYIYLPRGFQPIGQTAGNHVDCYDRMWVQYSGNLKAQHSDGRQIVVEHRDNFSSQIALRGQIFSAFTDNNGDPIYKGWPILDTPEDLYCTYVKINNVQPATKPDVYGRLRIAFYHKQICLLRRTINVLPETLKIDWNSSADDKHPAKLCVSSEDNLIVSAMGENVLISEPHQRNFVFQATGGDYPSHIILSIGSKQFSPVNLRIALPYYGAILYDHNDRINCDRLSLNQLNDKRIIVLLPNKKDISIDYTLLSKNSDRVTYTQTISTSNQEHQEIYLGGHSFRSLLSQLFSCSDSQDAEIKMMIWAEGRIILNLLLVRYNGLILWNNQITRNGCLYTATEREPRHFVVKARVQDEYPCHQDQVQILMMRLDCPESEICELSESIFLGNRYYDLPPQIYGEGLWLIYPAADSPIQFRPSVSDNASPDFCEPVEHHSLGVAVRAYHSTRNLLAINHIIAEMSTQPSHDGWSYLLYLKDKVINMQHIPLSTFEVWKELSKQSKALALAVLLLRLDTSFCERMRREVAVVWEWLPVDVWMTAIDVYRSYVETNMGDSVLIEESCIPENVLCGNEILRRHIFKGFLMSDDNKKIEQDIEEILSRKKEPRSKYNIQYNRIRQEPQLPTDFNEKLYEWLEHTKALSSDMVKRVRQLSEVKYDQSFVWLPIFAACVKAGKTQLDEILPDGYSKERFTAAFYQVYSLDRNWFNQICATFTCYLIGETE